MTSSTNETVGIAVLVNILADVLPHWGVVIGTPALTATIQGLVVIISGVVIYFKHRAVSTSLAQARLGGYHG